MLTAWTWSKYLFIWALPLQVKGIVWWGCVRLYYALEKKYCEDVCLCLSWCSKNWYGLWRKELWVLSLIGGPTRDRGNISFLHLEKLSAKSYFDAGLISISHHDHRQLVDFLSFACSPPHPILIFFLLQSNHFFFYFIFCTNQISTLFFICEIGRVSQAGRYWASTVQMHLPAKVQQVLSVRVKDKYPTGALSLFTWALHFFFFFFQDFYVICPDH